jgi:hypothetical protein
MTVNQSTKWNELLVIQNDEESFSSSVVKKATCKHLLERQQNYYARRLGQQYE